MLRSTCSRGVFISLLLVAICHAEYSLRDPDAKHTDQAIAYDQAGEQEKSLAAFEALVAYAEKNNTTLTEAATRAILEQLK